MHGISSVFGFFFASFFSGGGAGFFFFSSRPLMNFFLPNFFGMSFIIASSSKLSSDGSLSLCASLPLSSPPAGYSYFAFFFFFSVCGLSSPESSARGSVMAFFKSFFAVFGAGFSFFKAEEQFSLV